VTERDARPDDGPVVRPIAFKPTRDAVDERHWIQRHRNQLLWGGVALGLLWFIWFIFTAKSVRIVTDPHTAELDIDGGFNMELGGVHILREGNYALSAVAEGYFDLDMPLTVGAERNQEYRFELTRLPGLVSFNAVPEASTVVIDATALGQTPLLDVEVPAGMHRLLIEHPRYQPYEQPLDVEGRHTPQSVSATLQPNWANYSLSTMPPGATIHVDDEVRGTTPDTFEVLAGRHELRVKLAGYKTFTKRLEVVAQQDVELDAVTLQEADGLVLVSTRPRAAGVMVDGSYRGESPLELNLKPGRRYQIRLFKPGYQAATRNLDVESNAEHSLKVDLKPLTGTLIVQVDPGDAELLIDGRSKGRGNQTVSISAMPHSIEVRKPGYAGYSSRITPQPGMTQELKVKLLTVAAARLAALTPTIRTFAGQELVLLEPGSFTMGASRREPGRRANEILREVDMTRLFYLGTTEVTNAEFRKFAPGHSSGEFEDHNLDGDDQPVVRVTWEEAAEYCNWLSDKDGLPAFYRLEMGTVVGFNPTATGYRLPTEAEWAWASRPDHGAQARLRYPWGNTFPPPDRHGNYADRSASHLVGRVVFGYNDNYIVSAPVKTFPADSHGTYDLAGNVAEWVHDYYEIPSAERITNPLGPESGEYHVIRGSSWMHGTITDLRLTFRDYGSDGRPDMGFRIARFAE
jgi:formylglycine-generating enzyme required for sulfatase activity